MVWAPSFLPPAVAVDSSWDRAQCTAPTGRRGGVGDKRSCRDVRDPTRPALRSWVRWWLTVDSVRPSAVAKSPLFPRWPRIRTAEWSACRDRNTKALRLRTCFPRARRARRLAASQECRRQSWNGSARWRIGSVPFPPASGERGLGAYELVETVSWPIRSAVKPYRGQFGHCQGQGRTNRRRHRGHDEGGRHLPDPPFRLAALDPLQRSGRYGVGSNDTEHGHGRLTSAAGRVRISPKAPETAATASPGQYFPQYPGQNLKLRLPRVQNVTTNFPAAIGFASGG